jgi:hypothetical protein
MIGPPHRIEAVGLALLRERDCSVGGRHDLPGDAEGDVHGIGSTG